MKVKNNSIKYIIGIFLINKYIDILLVNSGGISVLLSFILEEFTVGRYRKDTLPVEHSAKLLNVYKVLLDLHIFDVVGQF